MYAGQKCRRVVKAIKYTGLRKGFRVQRDLFKLAFVERCWWTPFACFISFRLKVYGWKYTTRANLEISVRGYCISEAVRSHLRPTVCNFQKNKGRNKKTTDPTFPIRPYTTEICFKDTPWKRPIYFPNCSELKFKSGRIDVDDFNGLRFKYEIVVPRRREKEKKQPLRVN